MNLPDLIKPIYDKVAAGTKRFPQYTNRASGLGYAVPELNGCLRRGVLSRTKWQESDPFSTESLLRLREGSNQEAIVLRDLAEAGIQVINQQEAYEWREYQISGHLDGVILVDGVAVPLEIKSASPNIFQSIYTFEDLNKKPWLRAYKCQITLYQLHKNIDKAIMVFKDKSSGSLKQINVDLDYQLGEYCIRAAEAINRHIADNTLPDRIKDVEVCKDCPMKTTCAPGINFGVELTIGDDPAFVTRLEEYLDLKPTEKRCKDVYDVIKDRVKATAKGGPIKLMVGPFMIEGKTDAKGAMRFDIERLK